MRNGNNNKLHYTNAKQHLDIKSVERNCEITDLS